MKVLEAEGISKRFGGLSVLRGFTLTIDPGQIVALIGPNGAGKTTFLNCVSGLLKPDGGSLRIFGSPALELSPARRARLGVGRTFQTPELFRQMTVLDNLHVPAGVGPWWRAIPEAIGTPGAVRREREHRAKALGLARALGLGDVAGRPADTLSLGSQRILELGRALATGAKLLLLDEPGSGLDGAETAAFGELLLALRDEMGVAALLVEHDMALVGQVADWTHVLNFGTSIASGRMEDIRQERNVIEAYLG